MRIKLITPNQYGKIEFTKKELEEILNEAYNEGYKDGSAYLKVSKVNVDYLGTTAVTIAPYDYTTACSASASASGLTANNSSVSIYNDLHDEAIATKLK